MRVLMFGWEFPPHISGGLGTACFGLTNSLSKENIDVLFVVPKLHGDESAGRTSFINASEIPIDTEENNLEQYVSKSNDPDLRDALQTVIKKGKLETIEVPSTLSAYRSLQFGQHSRGVEHWNYPIESREKTASTPEQKKRNRQSDNAKTVRTNRQEAESKERKIAPYRFSGAYGPDLLDEVRRYAQVGASIAAENKFDVIHAHDWMTYLAGIAAKKVSGKPLVVHVHATEFDRSGECVDSKVWAIERQGMEEADRVITVSEWTRRVVINRYKIAAEKVEVVHNGIIPRNETSLASTAPPVGSHVVTFLGRITHQKGPLYFVEAARRVLDQIPDAHFVVAGAGDLLPLMIERIAQLRMSSRFHFTGFLRGKDIDRVWAMSKVYVMPSVSEPFGIAPLEAIQAGVPVIISNQSGVAEVMPHAIKVDFWNFQELASAICSVLKYKSLSNTLKKNSTEEIMRISWNNAAKKLNLLYHELTIEQRCA
jgi:glycogen synthase